MLQLAKEDERFVGGAAVDSLADGSGDRFSDLNLASGIADGVLVFFLFPRKEEEEQLLVQYQAADAKRRVAPADEPESETALSAAPSTR